MQPTSEALDIQNAYSWDALCDAGESRAGRGAQVLSRESYQEHGPRGGTESVDITHAI